jgi:hypothetical protein
MGVEINPFLFEIVIEVSAIFHILEIEAKECPAVELVDET